jgi:hypothetical protein
MLIKLGAAFVCFLLIQTGACDAKGGGDQNPKPVAAAQPATGPGACALIENSEIEEVQGAQVRGSVPSGGAAGDMVVSQCYYTAISADGAKNLSVHVEVMRGAANKSAVTSFWEEKFLRAKEKKKSEKPKPVSGVGDAAFWTGNERTGALYVLAGDRVVRISVGGPDPEAVKIQKSRALAGKALKRLG